MNLKSCLRLLIPSKIWREMQLRKIRRKLFGNATTGAGIQSVNVSSNANLHATTEIAEGVFVGGYANIGRHTYIQRGSEVLAANIGDFCSIGTNCHIGMFEHPMQNVTTSSRLYLHMLNENKFYNDIPELVNIGNDVWIGSNSTILGGVTIGNGAVIGAGAVVTKDVPPYTVVGGVPAKIIKYRFDQKTIEKLQRIQWWNWTDEEILHNREFFLRKPDEEVQ